MNQVARLLLRLYPESFRDRFGAELLEMIAQDRPGAGAGVGARTWFLIHTTFDLLRSALMERVSPSWQEPRNTEERDPECLKDGAGHGHGPHALRS